MNLNFKTKIISFVSVACVLCTAAAVYIGKTKTQEKLEAGLIEKSEAIISRLEGARKYVANQGLLDETIAGLVKKYPDGNLPEAERKKVLNVVPIYAALKIGAEEASKDNYTFRVPALEARRKENVPTAEETKFLEKFEADPNLKQQVHISKEENAIWVMRPIRLTTAQGCFNCHGAPSTSPWKNGKDILGFQMEDWKEGHLHGMFKISSSLAPVQASLKESAMDMAMWSGGVLILSIAFVLFLLKKPLTILTSITEKLGLAAKESLKSSEDLGATAQSVSSATAEQAAAIQETMASMAEMSSMVAKTLDLAKQTQGLSTDLDETSKSGSQVMQGMLASMESIKSSNEELKKMVQIINDISTKTNVINDIVFKTQLLSVNASIEAARAGQHGKGFAVVAEEVGNLALVSGKAAEEIREMLTKSQTRVQEIVSVTNERVAEGEKVSQEAMRTFVEISDGISKIQGYSQSVNEATTQQQDGINQISVAMTQMDEASQMNSQEASNVSGLSQDLIVQSQELATLSTESQILMFGKEMAFDDHSPKSGTRTDAKLKDSSSGSEKPRQAKKPVSTGASLRKKFAGRMEKKKMESNPSQNDLTADSQDFEKAG